MSQQPIQGRYTVDFDVIETGAEISAFNVKAYDADQAERLAREMLHPQFTYRCTAIDRVRNA
ncbi:hypothetical protein POK33_37930 [Burkholderia cenocepacia]|uniref:hypothetical protein n=1 Tax=Burkholderia cenocepacia TaxID=95486 RepID=UPI0023BA02CA|nr:hypothetical protein [Burkholderia cenocepacia]MDF0506536.1 hypothetical protein [Burkholderia cenocepacia]